MIKEYDYFIVTLCNTDLENQEIEFYNHEQAQEAASRLRKFLPVSLIHSIVLEGIHIVDVDSIVGENRTELNF